MEIVGFAAGTEESLVAASVQGANMIIAQERAEGDEPCLSAIIDGVPLTILAIKPNGSEGTAIDFRRRTLNFQAGGKDALAQAVRTALGTL